MHVMIGIGFGIDKPAWYLYFLYSMGTFNFLTILPYPLVVGKSYDVTL